MTDKKSLPVEFEKRLNEIKAKYPDQKSAVMPALYLAQEHFGYINDEAITWVSESLSIPPVHVMEVATFYTMYYKKPVGRYHIQVCRTLSCALKGSKKIVECLKAKFGIGPNEVSPCGMWSYEEVECLGSCGTAPMCQINDIFFENLSEERVHEIIKAIEESKPELRYSTLKDEIGEGLKGYPKSEVI